MNRNPQIAWRRKWLTANIGILILSAPLACAGISPVNTGFLNDTVNRTSYTMSFDASGGGNPVGKLIVSVATESNPPVTGITYHGAALTLVPGTGAAAAGRNRGIWILDLDSSYPGGAANLVVSGDGTSFSHMRLGIASISGSVPGYSVANIAAATSVDLPVPVAGSFVFAAFAANDQAAPAAATPLTPIFGVNSDSAAAAAGRVIASAAGPATYSFTGNTNAPQTSAVAFVPADAVPVIVATSPADDEINIAAGANLVATFSQPVLAATGTITLKKTSDNSTVETFDVASSPRLALDGATLTIDPSGDLAAGVSYHVLIDPGVFTATYNGNPFAGITDPTGWNFTGDSPPIIAGLVPEDDAIYILPTANLVATFNESVAAGTGTITLKKTSDNSTVESFDVATSSRLTISGTDLTIDPTGNLQDGVEYHVLIDPTAIVDNVANPFAGISNPATWSFTTRPGLDTVDGRLLSMIQANINNPWPGITNPNNASGIFPYALACLHLDQNVSQANDLLSTFYANNPIPDSDTTGYDAYFWQHILWRLYLDPAMNARLTPAVRSTIETNMWRWLRTRSTLAEAQGSEWIIHDSENHDAMQKGSHLLCLVALKNAPGYGPGMVLADGNTLAAHLQAWTDYFIRYFRSRAKEGINVEIASPIYAKYSVGAYYNLMDFTDSPVLRHLAKTFIDLYWADTASDWTLSGVRGGGETRCYKDAYLRLGTQYSFRALLWGYGWHQGSGVVRTYPMIPAVSSYRVPEIITACASDPARPNFLYTSRRFGRGGNWDANRNYTVVFDSGNSNLRRDTFVTPDYSMGTFTVDMNKAYIALIDQNRAMGVMFASGANDRVMVFGKGGTADVDKSFADISGVTRANCMVVQRDPNASQHGNATLVFVSTSAYNSRVETGGWFFTQRGNAYCAIKPAGGGYTAASAAYGYELQLGDMWAPVIIQMGQAGDYTDFTDFQNSVIANALTYVSGTMNYTSEAGDTFTFYANTKTTPKVNGTTVNLNPAKTYDSPYLSMVHGADTATVSYTGFPDLTLDFGDPPVLLATDPVDDATGVVVFQNLVATFSEPVVAGTGSIVLRRTSDNSVVESFNVATSPRLSFSGSTLTIDPTANLATSTSYYVTIDATAVENPSGAAFVGLSGNAAWNFTTSDSDTASIIAVNNGSFGGSAPGVTVTEPISVGTGADMLIVMTSAELGSGGMTVTYGGVPMNWAVGNKTNSAIWYLDLSTPGISGTDVVVDLSNSGSRNGFVAGWVSVDANLGPDQSIVVHSTGTSAASSNTVELTTTVQTFNVVNFNANNTSRAITVNSPNPTVIYTDNNIGSAEGAAAYATEVAAGTSTYQWTLAGLTPPAADYRRIDAAAFAVASSNTFANWIAGYPGVGGQTGLNDDPDGDGDPNGVEAWFGTHPAELSAGLANLASDGITTTFTHPQNETHPADVNGFYQWSPNLVDWYACDGVDGPPTGQTVMVSSHTVDTTTTVTATAGESMAGLFLRAAVEQNPSP